MLEERNLGIGTIPRMANEISTLAAPDPTPSSSGKAGRGYPRPPILFFMGDPPTLYLLSMRVNYPLGIMAGGTSVSLHHNHPAPGHPQVRMSRGFLPPPKP